MNNGFDIFGEVQLRVSAGNLASVSSQIKKALSQNMGGGVDVGVNPRALATVNRDLQSLTKNLSAVQSAAARTSSANLQVTQSFATMGRAARETDSTIESLAKNAGITARRFAVYTTIAGSIVSFLSTARQGTAEAIKFERELVRINQLGGTTAKDIDLISSSISRLSTGLGVSSRELSLASVTLKQTGLTAVEVAGNLDTLAAATLAPNFESMAETTEGMIAIMRQFNTDVEGTRKAIGAMNAVAGEFAVEAQDLIEVVRKTGGAFRSTGGDVQELFALFTSVRSTTRETAETIATGLRTIFTRIQRGSTVDFLRDLQINLRYTAEEAQALGQTDLTNQFVGGYEAIRRLSEALANLRATDPRYAAIVEELGGFRQVSKAIPLIQQFGEAQRALAVARAGDISLAIAQEKAQASLENRIEKSKETILNFFRTVVENDGFQRMTRNVLALADGITTMVNVLAPALPILAVLGTISAARSIAVSGTSFIQGATQGRGATQKSAPFFPFATGGTIPGTGNTDTVPALLTPGEYVIRKEVAQKIGYANLDKLNVSGFQKFGTGGRVFGKLPEEEFLRLTPQKQRDHLLETLVPAADSLITQKTGGTGAESLTGVEAQRLSLDSIFKLVDEVVQDPGKFPKGLSESYARVLARSRIIDASKHAKAGSREAEFESKGLLNERTRGSLGGSRGRGVGSATADFDEIKNVRTYDPEINDERILSLVHSGQRTLTSDDLYDLAPLRALSAKQRGKFVLSNEFKQLFERAKQKPVLYKELESALLDAYPIPSRRGEAVRQALSFGESLKKLPDPTVPSGPTLASFVKTGGRSTISPVTDLIAEEIAEVAQREVRTPVATGTDPMSKLRAKRAAKAAAASATTVPPPATITPQAAEQAVLNFYTSQFTQNKAGGLNDAFGLVADARKATGLPKDVFDQATTKLVEQGKLQAHKFGVQGLATPDMLNIEGQAYHLLHANAKNLGVAPPPAPRQFPALSVLTGPDKILPAGTRLPRTLGLPAPDPFAGPLPGLPVLSSADVVHDMLTRSGGKLPRGRQFDEALAQVASADAEGVAARLRSSGRSRRKSVVNFLANNPALVPPTPQGGSGQPPAPPPQAPGAAAPLPDPNDEDQKVGSPAWQKKYGQPPGYSVYGQPPMRQRGVSTIRPLQNQAPQQAAATQTTPSPSSSFFSQTAGLTQQATFTPPGTYGIPGVPPQAQFILQNAYPRSSSYRPPVPASGATYPLGSVPAPAQATGYTVTPEELYQRGVLNAARGTNVFDPLAIRQQALQNIAASKGYLADEDREALLSSSAQLPQKQRDLTQKLINRAITQGRGGIGTTIDPSELLDLSTAGPAQNPNVRKFGSTYFGDRVYSVSTGGDLLSKALDTKRSETERAPRDADARTIGSGASAARYGNTEARLVSERTKALQLQQTYNQTLDKLTKAEFRVIRAHEKSVSYSEAWQIASERAATALNRAAVTDDRGQLVAFDSTAGGDILTDNKGEIVGTSGTLAAYGGDTGRLRRRDRIRQGIGRFARGVGSRISSANAYASRFINPQLGQGFAFAASVAAPVIRDNIISPLVGPATARSGIGYQAGQGVGGLLSGAAFGASVGGLASGPGAPLGVAIGAVVGGLAGLVSSLKTASEEIDQIKINEALSGFADKLNTLRTAGITGDPTIASAARQSILATQEQEASRNQRQARGWLGFIGLRSGSAINDDFSALQRQSTRNNFGEQIVAITETLSLQANQLAKSNLAKPVGDLVSQLEAGNQGLNAELIKIVADLRDIPVAQLRDELTKQVKASQDGARVAREFQASQNAQRVQANQFGRIPLSLQEASDSLLFLNQRSQGISDSLGGTPSASRVFSFSNSLSRFGRNDNLGNVPFDIVSGVSGEEGQRLRDVGGRLNDIARSLPSVLSASIQEGGPLEGADLTTRIRTDLASAIGADISDPLVTAIVSRLNAIQSKDGPDEIATQITRDVVGFADDLLGEFDVIREVAQEAASRIESGTNAFIDGVQRYAQQQQQLRALALNSDRISVVNRQRNILFSEQRAGRTGVGAFDATDDSLILSAYQNNLDRLTGLPNARPFEIGELLQQATTRRDQLEQRQQEIFQRPGGANTQEFRDTVLQLATTKTQISDFQQALRTLANENERAALIQERLNRIEEERTGRLSLVEKFATADPRDLVNLNRSLALTGSVATGQTQFGSLSVQDRRGVLDILDSSRGSTLFGQRTEDIRLNAIQSLVGGNVLNASQTAREEELRRAAVAEGNTSEAAAGVLQREFSDASNKFFTSLTENQDRFFSRLEQSIKLNAISSLEGQRGAAAGNFRNLQNLEGDANTLRGFGFDTDLKVDTLRNNREKLQELIGLRGRRERLLETNSITLRNLNKLDDADLTVPNTALDPARVRELVEKSSEGRLTGQEVSDITSQYLKYDRASFTGGLNLTPIQTLRLAVKNRILGESGLGESVNNDIEFNKNAKRSAELTDQLRGAGVIGLPKTGLPRSAEDLNKLSNALESFIRNSQTFGDLATAVELATTSQRELAQSIDLLRQQLANGQEAAGFAAGGSVFRPRGTDTVPAMLTPGEFVVNREAAQANMDLLKEINRKKTRYLAAGGAVDPLVSDILRRNSNQLDFNSVVVKRGDPTKSASAFTYNTGTGTTTKTNTDAVYSTDPATVSIQIQERLRNLAFHSSVRTNEQRERLLAAANDLQSIQNFVENRRAFQGRAEAARKNPGSFDVSKVASGITYSDKHTPSQNYAAFLRFGIALGIGSQASFTSYKKADGTPLRDFEAGNPLQQKRLRGKDGEAPTVLERYRMERAQQLRSLRVRQFLANREDPGEAFGLGGPGTAQQSALFGNVISGREAARKQFFDRQLAQNEDYNKLRSSVVSPQLLNLPLRGFTLQGFASGGIVPGYGPNKDTVPALLSPGEFVVNRDAASQVGYNKLQRLNQGGIVGDTRTAGGGSEATSLSFSAQTTTAINNFIGSAASFGGSVLQLSQTITSFSGSSQALVEAINSMPRTINGQFTHSVAVNINGSEALAAIMPELRQMVINETKAILARTFKEQLPQAGIVI